ncbi:hypothetical protein MGYG_05409 [Nannizzia gypsea CBS 118893]|uniref:Chalcone synthase B n=1 Tax=Arthroderma gypseum (strain ATCC MYA-4604 / CBS 118893) TaxID=535722 RepID=E4UVT6_ARTGP|nr:hypothetical protein MGYG_05409 [Nannizzia gypsea CBS 118893]EFR02413.1 hypothetical protein MGYG_05409 [Nannizzia gypsea CBS 118893]
MSASENSSNPPVPPGLFIVGLGSQYPPYLLDHEMLTRFAGRFYDTQRPGLHKLLQINTSTGIETRSSIRSYETGFACNSVPPSIADLDELFRQDGVDLAVQACTKVMKEAGILREQITDTVSVTCTNQGNPGYDLLVNERLGLPERTSRILLHGVGCAGGLSIMRVASQVACGATMRGKPACILAYACELCTPNVRHDLAEAEQCMDLSEVNVAGALFSDAAAAFILCNEAALKEIKASPIFELVEWDNALIPGTMQHLVCYTDPYGFRSTLAKDIPKYAKEAVGPMFRKLLPSYEGQVFSKDKHLDTDDFDWALHPGGKALIDGVQETMQLMDDQIRASREIYRTRGNSSSPTVLSVLDRLRTYEKRRDHVVAASFGPGLVIEMAMLKRCDIAGSRR